MIDLRTDTVTLPTTAMLKAMVSAELGDEQKREDRTVLALEARASELLGQDDAVFLPSATMANQIAVLVQTQPGDEILAEAASHIVLNELGGPAFHSGVMVRTIDGRLGVFSVEQAHNALRNKSSIYQPVTTMICVENSHNGSGGSVWPSTQLEEICAFARENALACHLDGSRLLNAAVATRSNPASLAGNFSSVTLCLSKGLGCPVGALLAGSHALVDAARRAKHLFGGAMRQAGVIAAAGLYALEHNIDRLDEDHRRARLLADSLSERGVAVRSDRVVTNFVQIEAKSMTDGMTSEAAIELIAQHGVGVSGTSEPGVLRAVTHLGVDDDAVLEAATRIAQSLVGPASRSPEF